MKGKKSLLARPTVAIVKGGISEPDEKIESSALDSHPLRVHIFLQPYFSVQKISRSPE